MTKQKRRVSYELLRIYAILTIMILHYQHWADALFVPGRNAGALEYLCQLLESICIPTLATYVMISGYFDHSTSFRWKKILALWLQVAFYSIGIHLACLALGIPVKGSSVWDLAMYFLPVMSGHYWFVTAFIVMEILAPVFNVAAEHLDRKAFKGIILALLVYFSLVKSFVPIHLTADAEGYDFGFFLLVYLIAAYIRKYGAPRFASAGKSAALYLGASALIYLLTVVGHFLNVATGSFSYLVTMPLNLNFIATLSGSVGLFLFFAHVEIKEGWFADLVRLAAPLSFGVYLIHCHVDIQEKWPYWFAGLIGGFPNNPLLFVLWMLAAVLAMFVMCCLIDLIRRALFARVSDLIEGLSRNKKHIEE